MDLDTAPCSRVLVFGLGLWGFCAELEMTGYECVPHSYQDTAQPSQLPSSSISSSCC